jgi:amidohydrolase
MLEEGVFGDLEPEAIFGLHAWPAETGTITLAPGPFMAGSDRLRIVVNGSQTHGAQPHRGVDPIVVSAQIVQALQTIPSRQMDAVRSPVIVTIGSIHGGVRYNIIPDRVEMEGTIRYLNPETRDDLEMSPFDGQGGLGRMYQLFGSRMDPLLDELNEVLVA